MKRVILLTLILLVAACSAEQEYKLGPAKVSIVTEIGDGPLRLLYPADKYIDYKVEASLIPDAPIVIDVAVDASLVDAYNESNGTAYLEPDVNLCTFAKGQVILPRFNKTSTQGTMVLHSEFLPETGQCLLPVVVKKVSGKNDVESEVLYMVVERFNIAPAEKLTKQNWKMLYWESQAAGSYASHNFVREDDPSSSVTGAAEDMIDGSYASIWAYSSKALAPFHFVIDLGKEYTIRQMDLWAQRGENQMGDPANTIPSRQCATATVEFATTLEGNGMGDLGGDGSADWFGRETFGPEVLKNQISNSVYFSDLRYARYIRFTYLNCYYTAADVAPRANYKGGALAELDLFGYNEKIVVE